MGKAEMRGPGSEPQRRYSESVEARTSANPFARQPKFDLPESRKEKTLCAPHEPQKVLVVELTLAPPDGPDALRGASC